MEDWSGFGSHRQWDFKFLELIFFFPTKPFDTNCGALEEC